MPEKVKPVEIELFSSATKCAGMATAYLCRSIALRSGRYAPGIHEHVFISLSELFFGGDIEAVTRWFRAASGDLSRLGYRLSARRVAFRTPIIQKWVEAGDGFRAAVLTTDLGKMHKAFARRGEQSEHAVGLILGNNKANKTDKTKTLQLIDPWPNVEHKRPVDTETLESAHRIRKYGTVLIFWSGHS